MGLTAVGRFPGLLANADQGHAQAVLVRAGAQVSACDFEVGAEQNFLNIGGRPGRLFEADLERELASLALQLDRAARFDLASRRPSRPE